MRELHPHLFADDEECAVIGCVLLDPGLLSDLDLKPDEFADDFRASVWKSIADLADKHGAIDALTVSNWMRDHAPELVGYQPELLVEYAEGVPSTRHASQYASVVREKALLRRLRDAGGSVVALIEQRATADSTASDEVEQIIYDASRNQGDHARSLELSDLIELRLAEHRHTIEHGRPASMLTHYSDFDQTLGGFRPGEFVVLAARPSMGKTAMGMCLAERVARGRAFGFEPELSRSVLFVSLEMTRDAVADRFLSSVARVNLADLRASRLDADTCVRLARAHDDLRRLPIIVDDSGRRTCGQMRARLRREIKKRGGPDKPGGIGLLVVDYLQLVNSPGRSESRQVEVAKISEALKSTAKELGVCVLCLAQLNRGSDAREDKRPRMSDLRESGAVEQDADVVMLLYREAYYHKSDSPQDISWRRDNLHTLDKAELIIDKNRNGPTGSVSFQWVAEHSRFDNWDQRYSGHY